MDLDAKPSHGYGRIGVWGAILLLCMVWVSYGLSPGCAAAQSETASANDSVETSSQEDAAEIQDNSDSDQEAESEKKEAGDTEETNEKESGQANQESKKEDSPKNEADQDEQTTDKEDTSDKSETNDKQQPGDKDATVETERPLEEEPPEGEATKKDDKTAEKKKDPPEKKKCVIGATATLMEKKSEIVFRARVDSGAKSCSLHVEQIKIDDESETMADNIGKVIHFEVKNGKGKKHWLKSKIDSYVIIKTSSSRTRRYKVPLTFQWKHMEKKVLVTLNNRNTMEYPLLVGRNFLRGDFLVDVELDSDD